MLLKESDGSEKEMEGQTSLLFFLLLLHLLIRLGSIFLFWKSLDSFSTLFFNLLFLFFHSLHIYFYLDWETRAMFPLSLCWCEATTEFSFSLDSLSLCNFAWPREECTWELPWFYYSTISLILSHELTELISDKNIILFYRWGWRYQIMSISRKLCLKLVSSTLFSTDVITQIRNRKHSHYFPFMWMEIYFLHVSYMSSCLPSVCIFSLNFLWKRTLHSLHLHVFSSVRKQEMISHSRDAVIRVCNQTPHTRQLKDSREIA